MKSWDFNARMRHMWFILALKSPYIIIHLTKEKSLSNWKYLVVLKNINLKFVH